MMLELKPAGWFDWALIAVVFVAMFMFCRWFEAGRTISAIVAFMMVYDWTFEIVGQDGE